MAIREFIRRLVGGRTVNHYTIIGQGYDPATDPYEIGRIGSGDELNRVVNGRILKYVRSADNSEWELIDWDWLPNKPLEFNPQIHGHDSDRHTGLLPITKVSGHIPGDATHIAVMFRAWRLAQRVITFK